MMNPYQPPRADRSNAIPRAASGRYRFAGYWLIAAGAFHLLVINTLPDVVSVSSMDWSPALLMLLGLLVLRPFRAAISLTRFMGWCMIAWFLLVPVFMLFGTSGSEMSYGRITVKDPAPWQVGLMLLCFAATFLPPWSALQRDLESEMKDELRL